MGGMKLLSSATLVEPFRLLTATLLSLLLPLSFLLLARLSTAHYLFNLASYFPKPQPSSLLIALFLYTNRAFLLALVSLFSIAALIHGWRSTARIKFIVRDSMEPISRPHLFTAWTLLCILQICVGLGIEGSIAAGIDGSSFGRNTSLLSRVIFFLGLHEAMLYWSRTVVKPVVDDTVFGFANKERWVEKVAKAASFGSLWWWRLRDEVVSLVVTFEVKKELSMGVGMSDFLGWWLYYLTLTIGMVRIVKGVMLLGLTLLQRCRRVETNPDDSKVNEDKV